MHDCNLWRNVRIALLMEATVPRMEGTVARSKCSAALPSVDRYLSALDSDYCIWSSFLLKHGNLVGSNRKNLESTHPCLGNQDNLLAGCLECVLKCVSVPHPVEI